jgi:prolipoprotein diacylglyceryltransferase
MRLRSIAISRTKRIEISLLLGSFLALTPIAWGTGRVGDFVNDYLAVREKLWSRINEIPALKNSAYF